MHLLYFEETQQFDSIFNRLTTTGFIESVVKKGFKSIS